MKRLGKLLAVLVFMGGNLLQAQACDPATSAWASPGETPSFLSVITGSYSHLDPSAWAKIAESLPPGPNGNQSAAAYHWLAAGQAKKATELLAPSVALLLADTGTATGASPLQVADLEVAGLAALVQEDLKQAEALFAKAHQRSADSLHCRLQTELLLTQFLLRYGMKTPQFPHFNGGFFNYLQDSLGWKPGAPDPNAFVTALNTVVHLYRLDGSHAPLYMELLGDLLSKDPQRFTANYLAALAYQRAGLHLDGAQAATYERKSLFALEAPRQAEQRFNLYRFTQLKKALAEDVDSANGQQKAFAAQDLKAAAEGNPFGRFARKWSKDPITVGFQETDRGKLAPILAKSKAQLAARELEVKRYAGDVDLKDTVKKDGRFNAYALLLIGFIVVAVIFIWRKLREASKK